MWDTYIVLHLFYIEIQSATNQTKSWAHLSDATVKSMQSDDRTTDRYIIYIHVYLYVYINAQ